MNPFFLINFISFLILQLAMNGFASYDFGSSKQSINNLLTKTKSHITYSNHKDSLICTGGFYNGIPVDKWDFIFKENKLMEMKLSFYKNKTTNLVVFQSIKKNIINSFGKYSLVEQNDGRLIYIWKFYFPFGDETKSTFITLALTNNQILTINSGITN